MPGSPDSQRATTRVNKVIPIVPVKDAFISPGADEAGDDSSVVASLYQSDKKIYARSVSGWFSHWRWAMVWITQLVFYGLPCSTWYRVVFIFSTWCCIRKT